MQYAFSRVSASCVSRRCDETMSRAAHTTKAAVVVGTCAPAPSKQHLCTNANQNVQSILSDTCAHTGRRHRNTLIIVYEMSMSTCGKTQWSGPIIIIYQVACVHYFAGMSKFGRDIQPSEQQQQFVSVTKCGPTNSVARARVRMALTLVAGKTDDDDDDNRARHSTRQHTQTCMSNWTVDFRS